MFSNKTAWISWALISTGLIVYLLLQLTGEDKSVYLPGKTSHGHYQIEMACTACHSDAFGSAEVLQDACMNCHEQELKIADDSHPKSKFTDPRNADRITKLDARYCVTCHVEHKAEITGVMGVTLPQDFCFKCHADIAEDRVSHEGMAFTTCASAGCHNFHDNRALYEDFLAKHLDEPDVLPNRSVMPRVSADVYVTLSDYPLDKRPLKKLTLDDKQAPLSVVKPDIERDWLETAHSQAGVSCAACHATQNDLQQTIWTDKPGQKLCASCHQQENKGFVTGKHGMRLKQDLTPMTPGMARSEMKDDAHDRELGCTSCHAAHRFDTRRAALESCLECHNDQHSLNYKKSKHFALWDKETTGDKKGTGVSCATCHLPRVVHKLGGKQFVRVQHNQNDNLRPNEKMIRDVCMHCHGLGFTIDALADPALIENNFSGRPGIHNQSMDLVHRRLKQHSREKH